MLELGYARVLPTFYIRYVRKVIPLFLVHK